MGMQYRCNNEGRRQAVASQKPPKINGIDYIEVEVKGTKGESTLSIYFIFNLNVPPNGKDLTEANVVIEGGVRVRNIEVKYANKVDPNSNVFTVTVNTLGDFSTYTLRIVNSKTDLSPPKDFDPQLSHIDFSFKVECPSEFDCCSERKSLPEKLSEPKIDYLAKDYASFRLFMLDRLSILIPDWKERSPADLQIALIEILAYVGDNLSYFQDAVATEAYLGTARKRTSIRRHSRLLGYFMHEGCNARAWVCFESEKAFDGKTVAEGTLLLTGGSDNVTSIDPDDLKSFLTEDVTVFETMYPVTVYNAHNCIRFYTWNNTDCCLPAGSTSATLLDTDGLSLNAGDVLIFEEICSPTTGNKKDADPSHRHPVRLTSVAKTNDCLNNKPVVEIKWCEEDALPFPLCISASIKDKSEPQAISEMTVARGNVVLADHGRSVTEPLKPALVPDRGLYRPRLSKGPLTYREKFNFHEDSEEPAVNLTGQEVRKVLPEIKLVSQDENGVEIEWKPQYDLLSSDKFAAEFVVETELDGASCIRFGEDLMGKKPLAGSTFEATYRIGNGREGNVGSESISHIVRKDKGITRVRNPLPSSGGTDPETIEQVRLNAPQAFRTQERAVTEADYAEIAQRHPGIQKARANIRWTGSWYTAFVTIDRKGGKEVDADFKRNLLDFFELYRIAGYDIEINGPVYVPLEIAMNVCVKSGYFRSNVKQSLLLTFSNYMLANGRRGFFHSDNFTFNQPLYLSCIYEAAMGVAGVASVEVTVFQRWGKLSAGEIDKGILTPCKLEIIRLDNDPNFPENGKISFNMEGGL